MKVLHKKYKLCKDNFKIYIPNIIRKIRYIELYQKKCRDFVVSFFVNEVVLTKP